MFTNISSYDCDYYVDDDDDDDDGYYYYYYHSSSYYSDYHYHIVIYIRPSTRSGTARWSGAGASSATSSRPSSGTSL